jgi:hypothetical protein
VAQRARKATKLALLRRRRAPAAPALTATVGRPARRTAGVLTLGARTLCARSAALGFARGHGAGRAARNRV